MVRTSSQQSRVIRLLVIVSPSASPSLHHIPTLIFLGVSRIGVMIDERTWEMIPEG